MTLHTVETRDRMTEYNTLSQSQHIEWKNIHAFFDKEEEKRTVKNEFDNDALTLEREKERFHVMLTRDINTTLRVDHLEKDDQGRDLFVLCSDSLSYVDRIRLHVKNLDSKQYSVSEGTFELPLKNYEYNGMRPLQNTVVIVRIPLKRLTRGLPLTLGHCAFYLFVIAMLCAWFYRIVIM